jgi:ssDNA-binding Zn-finger/Zn-ribbon topoisomerase 1
MDIFNVTCPKCNGQYYADVSLQALDVELHCPYCGEYFKLTASGQSDANDRGVTTLVRLAKDKQFYKPH